MMSEADDKKESAASADTEQTALSPEESPANSSQLSAGDGHTEPQGEDREKDTSPSEQTYDVDPSSHSAFHMEEEPNVDPEIVQQLTDGFIQRFLPTLEKSKTSVGEILNNQTVVMETLEQENAKFKDCTAHLDLSAMMTKAKNYHNKLLNIKRDMTNLHDKAAKLKKRALKLQQQKQKEELQKAHQEERELEKEQMLTAKVASPET